MKAPSNSSTSFEKHPQGSVTVVCTRIIDKGTVFNERKLKDERKLLIAYESEKLMESGDFKGQPFLIFSNFNYSMYQNSMLCKHIEQWLGRKFASQSEADDFDIASLLGKTAFVNIIYSDDGKWVNIGTIMPVPGGMTPPAPKGDVYVFDIESPDMKVFDKFSDGMKESIKKSREWQERGGQSPKSQQAIPKDDPVKSPIDERNPPAYFDDDLGS